MSLARLSDGTASGNKKFPSPVLNLFQEQGLVKRELQAGKI